MRILLWTDAFWPSIGGLEIFAGNLVLALKERGHVCKVITNRPLDVKDGTVDFNGIPVHGFSFRDTVDRGALRLLRKQHNDCTQLIESFKPDVIHLHGMARCLFHFVLQQKRVRHSAVLTLHDNLNFGRGGSEMAASLLDKVDAVAAISHYIEREVLAYNPRIGSRLQTILNALPKESAPVLNFPREPRVLALGRLVQEKGFDLAIKAFLQVAGQFPHATLTIAGDGPERSTLEEMAHGSPFRSRIHFAGWIDSGRVSALIQEHAVVLVPSRWQEPFGLVALQAAQAGRPVIASQTGALPEIVVDGVTGRLFENENLPSLVEALQILLGDEELRKKMGHAAHEHASLRFNYEILVNKYEDLYRLAVDEMRSS